MIKYENRKKNYFDKNGMEITNGCKIKYADGTVRKVYLLENDELGTDATNPKWIAKGRAFEGEYGFYHLTEEETNEVEVVA